jgi:phosphoenolpyruvate carboxykinase (ATP)
MDIDITRSVVGCALSGSLDSLEYDEDPLFHILVPRSCPNVPADMLKPRDTWADKEAFDLRARQLADDFSAHFDRAYGNKGIDPAVVSQCPGK